ncbi:hypothetical protein [Microcystis aeruginosa]|uniref:N-acetylmuramoyl-L-alanine amidase domain-containing protein n=1 Tax=Microcystis aeruginosa (strain NIES-843 / IAM M-2473) TaxID=449447 RepID=B0JMY6_MICAN|nr:hypothetical protein [Microcystis aeruginosa]BAG00150.1 unknown protein [Microcystis aeruginosa NIES-843]
MIFGFTLVIILFFQAKIQAQTVCQIVPTSQISSIDQAKCLLRQPKIFGNVGPTLTSLPAPFDQLLTRPTIDISKEQLRRYLQAQGINEADIGGSLDKPVSRTNNNNPRAELARYFIIHDTSTPNLGNDTFPNNINEASWEFNNFNKYGSGDNSPAHIIINRVGQSVTRKDFNTPWRSTRRESEQFCGVNKCKGLFLAVELVQPRKCQPNSGQTQCSPPRKNDAKSPDPGFTKAQLDRLAVVYIAASVRRGKWLIPAFHVVLDQIVPGGHDDPQNFNLDQWSKQLNDILTEIRS